MSLQLAIFDLEEEGGLNFLFILSIYFRLQVGHILQLDEVLNEFLFALTSMRFARGTSNVLAFNGS